MQLISTSKTQRRAVLLAAVMALSLVAMSAAFAGPAAAEVDTADRTIEETELAPGDSTTVTVEMTMGADGAPDVIEDFDPAFANVELTDSAPFYSFRDMELNGILFLWDDVDAGETVTLEYEVTVPEDAAAGEDFLFVGTAGSDTAEEETIITGDDTITVTEPEPGPFTVSNLEPVTANVDPEEEITVSADVTNTGNGAGESDVRLLIADNEVANETVDLEAGAAESVSFTVDAPAEFGSYTHTVETDDSEVLGTLTVGEIDFGVSELAPENTTVEQGDSIDVEAIVTNLGDFSTDAEVRLEIDGTVVSTQTTSLDAGDATTVSFSDVNTTPFQPGEYQHAIATDQDSAQGTLSIEPSIVTYQDEEGTVQTEQLRNAISDWRVDEIDTDLLRDVIIEWRQR